MARTQRNLWESVVSWTNLVSAYYRCRRRKRYRQPATEFDFAWEEQLLRLQRELVTGSYVHGKYRHFQISDPKPRKISAAPFRDRVVHHALIAVLEPVFERRFIFDSYACRTGKGTHRAIKRAQYFQRRSRWCLKTDIVKFFPNIDHAILRDSISRCVADSQVMALIDLILQSGEGVLANEATHDRFPGDDLLSVLRPQGLPIGNLTSQFFANVFLDPVDHFVCEELKLSGYIRYADDLLLFGESKQQLWEAIDRLSHCLQLRRLRLHPAKTQISPTRKYVTFLGFRVSPDQIRISHQTVRRFTRRARRQRWEYAHGWMTFGELAASLKAWRSHTRRANATGIIRELVARHMRFQRGDAK